MLFLHGGVTYMYPETLWWDIGALLEENAVVRERFVVVAPFASVGEPLAVVSATRTKVDRYGHTQAYVDDFQADATWATFVEACLALGPGKVDMTRLSALGYSMGGQGVWSLVMRYGSRLAAAVPFAGRCQWEDDSWANEQSIMLEASRVAIRCYCGKEDTGTIGWPDFLYLASRRGLARDPVESRESHGERLGLTVYDWGEGLRLCLVEGTASCHCCWDDVLHNESWFRLFTWLKAQRCAVPAMSGEPPYPASRGGVSASSCWAR